MPLTKRLVMVSLLAEPLEKLVEIEPLPRPFWGMVKVKLSSKLVDDWKPLKKLAVIEGLKGVPLVMKKLGLPIGKVVAPAIAGTARAQAAMAPKTYLFIS